MYIHKDTPGLKQYPHTQTDSHKHTETTPQKPALPAGGVITKGDKSLPLLSHHHSDDNQQLGWQQEALNSTPIPNSYPET